MSERAYLAFVVKNIAEIHQEEDQIKRNAIYAAAEDFIKVLGLEDEDILVDFLGQQGDLTLYTTDMVRLDDVTAWGKKHVDKWKEMAAGIVGPDCQPYFEAEYEDGSMEMIE
jgi:hypothetical protein